MARNVRSARRVELSARDIDLIGRVVATEVPPQVARRDPIAYRQMVGAVTDTVVNRLASGRYGNTVEEVLNDKRAFSKITGPARLDPYGSIAKTPTAPAAVQQAVNEHLAGRINGLPSIVGPALNYANPHYSDKKNLTGWINPMIQAGAKILGIGDMIHAHGLAPGNYPAPDVRITGPQGFMPPAGPNLTHSYGIPTPALKPSKPQSALDQASRAGPTGNFRVPDRFFGAPVGKVERGGPLAPPSPNRPDNQTAAGPKGRFQVPTQRPAPLNPAPVGMVERAPLAPAQRAAPVARPAPLQAVPAGLVTRGPSLPAPGPAPSPARPDNLNAAGPKGMFSVPAPAPVDRSVAPANPGQLGGITMSNPVGLGGPGGVYVGKAPLSPMQQAAAAKLTAQQAQTVAPPPPSPVIAPALAQVPAPALPPPTVIQPRPIAPMQQSNFPAAPKSPSFTASDIYGGQIGSALDNTGQNTVSRDPFGRTSVTNKFGATTVSLPDGRQAFGSIAGPLDGGGIKTPSAGGFFGDLGDKLTSPQMGQMAKTGAMGALGGGLGGLLGPAGAMLGGIVGRELSKPGGGAIGGLLNGTRTIDTSKVGSVLGINFGPTTAFARHQSGGPFPSAPSGALRDARGSNRSGESMRDISPAAARDISRGRAGLF